MTEGTKSYLIGCHQFLLHPIWVILAWRLEYRKWPNFWQTVCIFFHDVGICGRQYLSSDGAKKGHWILGAKIAKKIFPRRKAFALIAGHTRESDLPESPLFRADKRSWLVAPMWWMWWNYWIEFSREEVGITKPPEWKQLISENLRKENPVDSHSLYLNRKLADLSRRGSK